MLTDHLCAISWRSRPKSFVGLMTLYESNFIRLGWIAPGLERLDGRLVSEAPGDCPLELVLVERARFTSTLELSYLFDEGGRTLREPGLSVRVYHDARLAEACALDGAGRHAGLRRPGAALPSRQDARWSLNMLLNKWLEYCAERGHRFAPAAA